MKVLITGSNGLIGTALRQALRDASIPYDVIERSTHSALPPEVVTPQTEGPTTYSINWPGGLSDIPYSQYSHVVHLALARPDPRAPLLQSLAAQVLPLQLIIDGITKSNPTCSLLFFSSQSSSRDAVSAYGRGKWECEEIIRGSSIPWTIIRPGLVVSNEKKGLIGSISRLVSCSPIIPVPTGSLMHVQPILLTDVTDAAVKIIRQPTLHSQRTYDLALPPRPLSAFITQLCQSLGVRRIIIPIPWKLVDTILRCAEALPITLPLSRSNLEGLLASRTMESERSLSMLTMTLQNYPADDNSRFNEISTKLEATLIFKAMFGFDPPTEVIHRYLTAQRDQLLNGRWIDMNAILANRLDIEAVEFASRRNKTVLSQKIQIMCYVAEQSPALLPLFINKQTARLRAFVELGMAGVRAAWKLAYGTYLLKRYRLLERK